MPDVKTIYSKIINFQKNMPTVKKGETNPFYKSKYAPLDYIQKAIQKPLAEAGLGYFQEATSEGLKTTLFDIDGNTKEFNYPAIFQGKPQEIGSVMTYAKRYALTACLGLIIEGEDDDGQKANDSNQKLTQAQNPAPKINKTQNLMAPFLVATFGKEKGEWLKQLNFENIQITKEQAVVCGFKYDEKYDKNDKKWVWKAPNQKNLSLLIDPKTFQPIKGYKISKFATFNVEELSSIQADEDLPDISSVIAKNF
jgi:hypothetical protein